MIMRKSNTEINTRSQMQLGNAESCSYHELVSEWLTGTWNTCSVSSSNNTTHVRSRPRYGDAWGL